MGRNGALFALGAALLVAGLSAASAEAAPASRKGAPVRKQAAVRKAPAPVLDPVAVRKAWGSFADLPGKGWYFKGEKDVEYVSFYLWQEPGKILIAEHHYPTGVGYELMRLGPDNSIAITSRYIDGTTEQSVATIGAGGEFIETLTTNGVSGRGTRSVVGGNQLNSSHESFQNNAWKETSRSTFQAVPMETALAVKAKNQQLVAMREALLGRFGALTPLIKQNLRNLAGNEGIGAAAVEGSAILWFSTRYLFNQPGGGTYECIDTARPCSGGFKIEGNELYLMPSNGAAMIKWRYFPQGMIVNTTEANGMQTMRVYMTQAAFYDPSVRAVAEQAGKANAQVAAVQQQNARAAQQQAEAQRAREEAEWKAEQDQENAEKAAQWAPVVDAMRSYNESLRQRLEAKRQGQ